MIDCDQPEELSGRNARRNGVFFAISISKISDLRQVENLIMGLKGAGPYFQYHMANTIFPDLIYKILEVYLDDIITWGETLEELIENLTKIFSKLRVGILLLCNQKKTPRQQKLLSTTNKHHGQYNTSYRTFHRRYP